MAQSMPLGAVHPNTSSCKTIKQVSPIGIGREDQIDFPGPRPVLHGPLALDRGANLLVPFEIDEPVQAVVLSKALDQAYAVLPCRAQEVIGEGRAVRGRDASKRGTGSPIWASVQKIA
jgi:hypothetical protein